VSRICELKILYSTQKTSASLELKNNQQVNNFRSEKNPIFILNFVYIMGAPAQPLGVGGGLDPAKF